jgi:hypothetical protein
MSVAQTSMRVLDDKGSIYLPYGFSGEWSEAERSEMAAAIDPHVPERVDAMFNNWRFRKASDDHFMARKASWVMGSLSARSVTELAQEITNYYNR